MDSSEQQSELNEELQAEEVDFEEQARTTIKKEAIQTLYKLNFNQPTHRFTLAKSYRKINKLIDTFDNDKFNEDPNFVEDVLRSAYFFRPYDIGNFQFKFSSSVCRDVVHGNRRCQQPLVKIDNQTIIFDDYKKQKIVIMDKEFKLTIQSEPNSKIVYTNKPKSHPLLITEDQLGLKYFRKTIPETITEYFSPPCEFNIVVIKEFQKIQSRMICLKIISNEVQQNQYFQLHMGWAQRPKESFNYEDSNSGYVSVSYLQESESSQNQ